MKRVGVIGAGIFGCATALALQNECDVSLFERNSDIVQGATLHNHLRHHHGFHYPRSKETALESIHGKKSFEKEYGACIISHFPAYYAIAKEGSKTTPEDFITFCNDLGLPYKIVDPKKDIFNPDLVSLCIETEEQAYDPDKLREIIRNKLSKSKVTLRTGCEVVGGKILGNTKIVQIREAGKKKEEAFDVVIMATYVNFNRTNAMFGLPKKKVQYALMELLDIRLPFKEHIAAFVADGDFSTFVPSGEPGIVRLGHVKESVLKKVVSDTLDTDLLANENTESNKDKILEESYKFYPVLRKATFLRSVFTTRIIKANVDDTDERLTEVTDHGNGLYTIFGGKVITAVDTARRVAALVRKENVSRNR